MRQVPGSAMRGLPRFAGAVAFAALFAASGCEGEDLSGFYWDVTVKGTENECTVDPPNYSEKYEYRVKFDGNDIIVAVGLRPPSTISSHPINFRPLVFKNRSMRRMK